MNVTIDAKRCIACGACESWCPEVFRLGEGGIAEVVEADAEAFADRVREAAEGCPQGAIHVATASGGGLSEGGQPPIIKAWPLAADKGALIP